MLFGAGEQAAEHRAEHAGRAEHGQEVALVAGPLPRRHDVADDRQRHREQAAGADALDRAERGQLVHRPGQAAERGADDEDRDGEQEERLAAVDVGQLAVQRGGDRRGDEERGGGPGLQREAVEVVGDGPDRGGDHGLVQGGEEHPHHQADEDHHDLPVGEAAVGLLRRSAPGGRGGHAGSCSVPAGGPAAMVVNVRVSAVRVGAVRASGGQYAAPRAPLKRPSSPAKVSSSASVQPATAAASSSTTQRPHPLADFPAGVGDRQQAGPPVGRVGLAAHQLAPDQLGHLPADRGRVGVAELRQRAGALRALHQRKQQQHRRPVRSKAGAAVSGGRGLERMDEPQQRAHLGRELLLGGGSVHDYRG